MSRLVPISGLIEKAPACFLVETNGARLLLDFGEGPPPGRVPDLKKIGRVDALLFSHQHADHIGAVSQIGEIGTPQIFATEIVARALPADMPASAYLPMAGTANVLGIPIRTGRSGHAPGGVWIHFGIGDGLLYMGDNCTSSLIYAHDAPPRAGTIILDASYGIDDKPLSVGQATLDEIAAAGPLLLPVVTQGRGAEIALHFLRRGIMPSLDDTIRAAIIGLRSECVIPFARAELAALAEAPSIPDDPGGVMLTAPALAERGTSKTLIDKWHDNAHLQIVFTGFLDPSSPAAKLVSNKRARVVRWKIHPSLSENAETVRAVAAKTVLPCFGGSAANLSEWQKAFAPARVVIGNEAVEL
jgi:Cft2 family RNA processing exonuclease